MARHHGVRWTAVLARQILAEQERSGLTVEAFARSRGWNSNRLWWWRKRLGPQQAAMPALLPVRVVDRAEAPSAAGVEVLLRSGHTLRFTTAVDVVALVAMLDRPC